jgi:hypothetical protein
LGRRGPGRGSGTEEERMRRSTPVVSGWGEEKFPVIEGEAAAAVWMLRQGIFDLTIYSKLLARSAS